MSQLEPEVAPAGEDIHLPPGSLQPLMLTVGITIFLLGLTMSWWVWASGLLVTLWVLALWIRDARHEYAELPVHHGPDHPA